MMIGDAMTPFDPPFDPVLACFSFFFRCYLASNLMLQFSMFLYSMLPSSIFSPSCEGEECGQIYSNMIEFVHEVIEFDQKCTFWL